MPDLQNNAAQIDASLIDQARQAQKMAYAPYSKHHVGVALETKSGAIITGCNVECVDYDGLEAVEAALSRLVTTHDWRKDPEITTITRAVFAVPHLDYESLVHYPSPSSLGRLRFFSGETLLITFVDTEGETEECTLDDLLPKSPNIHQSMLKFSNQAPPVVPEAPSPKKELNFEEGVLTADLFRGLRDGRNHSIAPSSGYTVSVVITTKAGGTYSGCNIETALHSAIHAEETAIANMICNEGPNAQIARAFVMTSGEDAGWPCGSCRQKLFEFATKETEIFAVNEDGTYQELTLEALLPNGFTAAQIPNK